MSPNGHHFLNAEKAKYSMVPIPTVFPSKQTEEKEYVTNADTLLC
jgi:hypothetical protein